LYIRRIDVSKFEIFQAVLRNRLTLTTIFSRAVTLLIWKACFIRRPFNIFWMVICVK